MKKVWLSVLSLVLFFFVSNVNVYASTSCSKVYNQTIKDVHYNWGAGSPKGVCSDYFTAYFDQTRDFAAGDYFVQTYADDGVKVEFDGKYPINRWNDPINIYRAFVPQVSKGIHQMKTHFRENKGNAAIFSDIVPFDTWLAYYYSSTSPSGIPKTAKLIASTGTNKMLLDNNGVNAPSGVPTDNFSARYVTAKHLKEGDYVIKVKADDGVRVYIDGQLKIDGWINSSSKEKTAKVSVKNSTTQTNTRLKDAHWVEVQYYEKTGVSKVEVSIEPAYKVAKISKVNGTVQTTIVGNFSTYDEAVSTALKSGANVIYDHDQIAWIAAGGFAYVKGMASQSPTKYVYSKQEDTNANKATYLLYNTELKVLGVEKDWVQVQLPDTIGYMKKGDISLVPREIANRSYYKVVYNDVYKVNELWHYPVPGATGYLFGKAPSFLKAGTIYYSTDGKTFEGLTGQQSYQYFNYLSIRSKTKYTATQLDDYLKAAKPDSPLIGLGKKFKEVEQKYYINALFLLSVAIHESNYGTSKIAKEKFNLFGIAADDSNPGAGARTFANFEECIEVMARDYVSKRYANPARPAPPLTYVYKEAYLGNKSFGMNVWYSSDPYWGQKVAGHMYRIDRFLKSTDYKYTLAKVTGNILPYTLKVRTAPKIESGNIGYEIQYPSMIVTKIKEVTIGSTEPANEGVWANIISDNTTKIENGLPIGYSYQSGPKATKGPYLQNVIVVR